MAATRAIKRFRLAALSSLLVTVGLSPALAPPPAERAARLHQATAPAAHDAADVREAVLPMAAPPSEQRDVLVRARERTADATHARVEQEQARQAEAERAALPAQEKQPLSTAPTEQSTSPAPSVYIPVVGAGGQAAVDDCAGPVRFTPVTVSVSIAEHDLCGGWGRMSWIQPGTAVTVQGYGAFTAFGRMVVPRGAREAVLGGFPGGYPPIVLQTCIPGTLEMLLIALH